MGDVQLNLSNGTVLKLKDVRLVLSFRHNLISAGHLAKGETHTIFTNDVWEVTSGSLVVAHGKKENIVRCGREQWHHGTGVEQCGI